MDYKFLFIKHNYMMEIFFYRVDAAVFFVIEDFENYEISLQKAIDVVEGYGWAVGHGLIGRNSKLDLDFRSFLNYYPEYKDAYESAIEDGWNSRHEDEKNKIIECETLFRSQDKVNIVHGTDRRLITSCPTAGVGHEVYSFLPHDYEGPCAVFDSARELLIACVPTKDDALFLSEYCISPGGGRHRQVEIMQAPFEQITHEDSSEWLLA